MPLYRRVAPAERPGLYFIGFIQPLGPIMPLAEAQSEWVADLIKGRAALPARRRCGARSRPTTRMRKRFVASKRHTIEVDFHPYLREIRRERKRRSAGLTTRGRVRLRRNSAAASGAAVAPRRLARADGAGRAGRGWGAAGG